MKTEQQTAKHSPGPWKFDDHRNGQSDLLFTIRDSRNCYLASVKDVDGLTSPDAQANARLMAAAPDMLKALKEAAAELEARRLLIGNFGTSDKPLENVLAAIAKAEGGKP